MRNTKSSFPLSVLTLIYICLTVPFLLPAQSTHDNETHFNKSAFRFTKITEVPGKEQTALYRLAEYWAANNARRPHEKIQVQDRASGRIILTGSIDLYRAGWLGPPEQVSDYVLFTATIDTKDGKARLIMDHFVHYGGIAAGTLNSSGGSLAQDRPSASWFGKGRWNRIKQSVYEIAQKYLQSFQTTMTGEGAYISREDF